MVKLYQICSGLIAEVENSKHYALGNMTLAELLCSDSPIQEIRNLIEQKQVTLTKAPEDDKLLAPIHQQEVWASGVTYRRSRNARMEESAAVGGGDFYDRVYDGDRPELFFKSMPHNVVGHGGAVRIRNDSKWSVPEPELTLVINVRGKIVGYTVGNDMSARDIEGENPLYLPQAKIYNGSCAIGPCILLSDDPLPGDTKITLNILRDGATCFQDSIELNKMKRKWTQLVAYLYQEQSFMFGCFLMTGTGIVPQDNFTLQQNDVITITILPIGTLTNRVEI